MYKFNFIVSLPENTNGITQKSSIFGETGLKGFFSTRFNEHIIQHGM